MANVKKKPARPKLKLLRLDSPGAWVYTHPEGSLTVYGERGKPLTLERVNFLLDMAKQKLIE